MFNVVSSCFFNPIILSSLPWYLPIDTCWRKEPSSSFPSFPFPTVSGHSGAPNDTLATHQGNLSSCFDHIDIRFCAYVVQILAPSRRGNLRYQCQAFPIKMIRISQCIFYRKYWRTTMCKNESSCYLTIHFIYTTVPSSLDTFYLTRPPFQCWASVLTRSRRYYCLTHLALLPFLRHLFYAFYS